MKRRQQRRECTECGRKVTVQGDGRLLPHYPTGTIAWPSQKHCPGGVIPPKGLDLYEIAEEFVESHRHPPLSEGENSVRAIRAGLPTLGKGRR